MDIKSLSIIELKQLLSRVNQDINSIKRAERRAKKIAVNNAVSELAECNIIAQRFTGKIIPAPVDNAKLIADIQIQKDILGFIQSGGRIICSNTTGTINSKSVKGAKAGIKLFRRGFC
jgi:hypothetical protein